MVAHIRDQHRWILCVAAVGVWLAVGWPALLRLVTDTPMRGAPVPVVWLVAFTLFGAAFLGSILVKLRKSLEWTLLSVQVAAVIAMAVFLPLGVTPVFLIIPAWQVAMATEPVKALAWVAFQTLFVFATLAQTHPNFSDLYFILGLSFALQLCFVFTAHALRAEAETARALTETNRELRSAQVVIANTARNAERLRIARELHDAWGHELTALRLQLEIASHVTEPDRVNEHVMQAKALAGALLAKVRDVVGGLREDERRDLKDALDALSQSIPTPAIHVDIASDVRVGPEQAHVLIRCAQEAVTNAVKHADASNLWLEVASDGEGVRLVARDDGKASRTGSSPGMGLLGMRERVEDLGGRLAVQAGTGQGFTIEAWLPRRERQAS